MQSKSPRPEESYADKLTTGWHERGRLPHLKFQAGIYFVTFRAADSLPGIVLEQYRSQAGQGGAERDKAISARTEAYLDSGAGECLLGRRDIGDLVFKSLSFFEGTRYSLYAWVVMPNHVHVVVRPHPGHTLSSILKSWKSYTSHAINKILGRSGVFWQRESYDRLLRDEYELFRACEYIAQNPVKAGLCSSPKAWPFYGWRNYLEEEERRM